MVATTTGFIEPAYRAHLLAVARAYAAAKGLAIATVARRFHGTDSFLDDFAAGRRTVTLRKLDQMLMAFASDWPEGARWPGAAPAKKTAVKNGRRR